MPISLRPLAFSKVGCTIGGRLAALPGANLIGAAMDIDQRAADTPEVADDVDEGALASVMRIAPLGAAVLAGSAVALLVLGYLAIYFFVFLPRGPVG
jgi:hypothetical protein